MVVVVVAALGRIYLSSGIYGNVGGERQARCEPVPYC